MDPQHTSPTPPQASSKFRQPAKVGALVLVGTVLGTSVIVKVGASVIVNVGASVTLNVGSVVG